MSRSFPWKCNACREKLVVPVTVDYATEMEHDGRTYQFTVPALMILECSNCHTRMLPDEASGKIYSKLREEAGLLEPHEIRQNRETLGLTQKELAKHLGIADSTLSRWETGGQIQQKSLDRFLRCYFAYPKMRQDLANESALRKSRLVTEKPSSIAHRIGNYTGPIGISRLVVGSSIGGELVSFPGFPAPTGVGLEATSEGTIVGDVPQNIRNRMNPAPPLRK